MRDAEAAQGGDAGAAARALQQMSTAVHVAQAALFEGRGLLSLAHTRRTFNPHLSCLT
jgi:hypothetical protein